MRILTGLSGSMLVLALAVTGCGSDSDKEPQGTSSSDPSGAATAGVITDACKLVTPGNLEATFGSPFGDGKLAHQTDSGADQCVWTSTGSAAEQTFSVIVLRQAGVDEAFGSGGLTVAQLFEQTKAAYPNAEPVELGDEAYASVTEVQVLANATWYSFSLYGGSDSDSALDGVKGLAAQVVG